MTLERKIARAFALDDETLAAACQPMERTPAQHRSSHPRPRVLEPALARVVCPRPGCSCPALDLVQSTHLSRPESFDHWASKAVFGERVWLNRDVVPVPVHHRTVPNILSAVSGIGMLFVFWGVFAFDLWPTVFGMALVYCGKLWFLDRMAWLWEDMKDVPGYSKMTVSHESVED